MADNKPTVFDPFREMDEFLERSWPARFPFSFAGAAGEPAIWRARIDEYEQDGNLVIKADLPGVKREDISIELDGGVLTIKGEMKEEKETTEKNVRRSERRRGSIYRQIPVPAGITHESIDAKFDNGVLEIRMPIPKVEAPAGKQITIK